MNRSYSKTRTTSIGNSGNRQTGTSAALRSREASLRHGFAAFELVLTLPLLFILLLGLFEFSMLFHARSSVIHASRVGARAASIVGVDPLQIEQEVRKVLSPKLQQGLQVQTTPAARTGSAVVVGVSVPMLAASPDLLWPIGYSLQGRQIYAETCMIRE